MGTETSERIQRERLERHIGQRIRPITCLKGVRVLGCSPMSLTLEARVTGEALNVRGFAHGGWLFTLCDTASGALVFSRGLDCVTQNASITYLRGASAGETVRARLRCVHWGRASVVNEVTLLNQDDRPLVVATLTMFVMGPARE